MHRLRSFKKYTGAVGKKVDNSRRAVAQRYQAIQTGEGIDECAAPLPLPRPHPMPSRYGCPAWLLSVHPSR